MAARIERRQVDRGCCGIRPVADCARDDPPSPRNLVEDRAAGDALARTGFADDADRLAAWDGKGDAVDRLDRARTTEEMGPEINDLDQRVTIPVPAAGCGKIGISIHRDLQHRVIHHRGN